jgi:beta-galactosidase GanA
MGSWKITGRWGEWAFGEKSWTFLKADPPAWADQPVGGLAVIQLADDEFLLIGDHVRVIFERAAGGGDKSILLRVEEGRFESGEWRMKRVWNGDQTDWGLNLIDRPQVLRVTMARYR